MPCCKNFHKTTHGWMANLFGVYLKNGTMPKITEPANFLDWSWWFWITPNLHGTILARPRFHFTILGYLLVSNLVFWNEYFANYELIDDDNSLGAAYVQSWASRLMVFVLTGFMFRLVTAYWVGTRLKAAKLLIGTSKVVDVLKLSKKEVADMFKEHGYEAEPLLKLHVKNTINKLHWGILQSVKKERMPGGCLESMDSVEHVQLLESMALMSGGAMSTMSCTSSNKLPFALFHLVNWVVSESCTLYCAIVPLPSLAYSQLCSDSLTNFTDKTYDLLLSCDCLWRNCKRN